MLEIDFNNKFWETNVKYLHDMTKSRGDYFHVKKLKLEIKRGRPTFGNVFQNTEGLFR